MVRDGKGSCEIDDWDQILIEQVVSTNLSWHGTFWFVMSEMSPPCRKDTVLWHMQSV